jgi:hypothetical protein
MEGIILWRLVIDGCLVLSVAVLSMRLWSMKGPTINVGLLKELEVTLRGLLREAESASLKLNAELAAKQKSLSQNLADAAEVEQRLDEALATATEIRRDLTQKLKQGGKQARRKSTERPMQPEKVRRTRPLPEQPVVRLEQQIERVSVSPSTRQEIPSRSSPAKVALNIYGEPISAQPITETPRPTSRLRHAIEKIVEKQDAPIIHRNVASSPEASLENIYDKAEQLLREGMELESVAARTALPLEEVAMLSQIVEKDKRESNGFEVRDQRLGALTATQQRDHGGAL